MKTGTEVFSLFIFFCTEMAIQAQRHAFSYMSIPHTIVSLTLENCVYSLHFDLQMLRKLNDISC